MIFLQTMNKIGLSSPVYFQRHYFFCAILSGFLLLCCMKNDMIYKYFFCTHQYQDITEEHK